MKKIIVALLLTILLLMQLAACKTDKTPADTTTITPETTVPQPVEIVLNSKDTLYTIISSEDASEEVEAIASGFWKSMFSASLSQRLQIDVDWVQNKEDADNDNYEILIGETNRPETAEAKELLNTYLDYAISVSGNKIAIIANTAERLADAVDYFKTQLTVTDGTLKYIGKSQIVSTWDKYEYANMSICGNSIADYNIIVSKTANAAEISVANDLVDLIANNVGCVLNVLDDTTAATDKEIIIGKTSRPETASEIKGSKISTVGKKLVIQAQASAYYHSAKSELFKLITENKGIIAEGLDISVTNSAFDFFLADNYASGIIKDEVNLGVQALLSCCEYYSQRLLDGTKNGEKWVYSNSSTYVPQRGTFDSMIERKMFGANCASPVNWAFMDMGIMPTNQRFYGGSTGGFAGTDEAYGYVSEVCEIYNYHSDPIPFKQLYNEGKIKAGDIILAVHHTYIYRGDQTFYAAGHDGDWHTDPTAETEDKRKAVFENWICDMYSNTNYKDYEVHYLIRFKDDYVPEYYRNHNGEVVKNPMVE